MIKKIRKHKKKIIVIVSILIVLVVGSVYGTTLFNSNAVSYDNGTTGLKSRNVQNAIDELYSSVLNGCKPGYSKGEDNGTVYVCNKESSNAAGTTEFDSNNVRYNNNNKGLTATTVQGAISELAGLIGYCKNNYSKQNETSSSYECKINTLPSTLTVTESVVNLTYNGTSSDNSYSYNGDGVVSCTSSDTTKVTCTIDTANNKVVLSPVGATTGGVTITVSATATPNYYAPTDATFTVNVSKATLTCPTQGTSSQTYTGSTITYGGSNCPSGSSRTDASGINVGTYYSTCTADPNHQFSSTCNPGKLTITAKAASFSCSNKTYTGSSQTACTCTNCTLGTGCSATNAGSYTCNATANANYTLSTTSIGWTMNKAASSITCQDVCNSNSAATVVSSYSGCTPSTTTAGVGSGTITCTGDGNHFDSSCEYTHWVWEFLTTNTVSTTGTEAAACMSRCNDAYGFNNLWDGTQTTHTLADAYHASLNTMICSTSSQTRQITGVYQSTESVCQAEITTTGNCSKRKYVYACSCKHR